MTVLGYGKYRTEAECFPYAAIAARQALVTQLVAVNAGRLRVDASAAATCIARITERACTLEVIVQPSVSSEGPQPDQAVDACQAAFVGTVPAGGTCFDSTNCVPGTGCVVGINPSSGTGLDPGPFLGAGGLSEGVCVAYQPAGGPCNTDYDCDPKSRLYCGADYRCGAPVAEGQPCSNGQEISAPTLGEIEGAIPASRRTTCDPAALLYCDVDTERCRHLPRANEPCLTSGLTPGSAVCDDTASPPLTCVGPGFNGSGICLPPAKSGEACGGSGLPVCGAGLWCDTGGRELGTCQPLPGIGQPCTETGYCLDPGICDDDTLTCLVRGATPDGARCARNGDCLSLTCGQGADGGSDRVCWHTGPVSVSCTGNAPAAGAATDGGSGDAHVAD